MVLSVLLNLMSFEPLAQEYLGMTFIDKPHGSTRACFSAFAHGDPHWGVPFSLCFSFVENLILSFKAQPTFIFPVSEKLWH